MGGCKGDSCTHSRQVIAERGNITLLSDVIDIDAGGGERERETSMSVCTVLIIVARVHVHNMHVWSDKLYSYTFVRSFSLRPQEQTSQ